MLELPSGALTGWLPIFSVLASTLGVVFLGSQLMIQNRVSRSQFIEQLSRDVDRHADIERRFESHGDLYQGSNNFDLNDLSEVVKFLTFFERISLIEEMGALSLQTIDELFGYRFFLVMHNPNVQHYELLRPEVGQYYTSIFRLHRKWKQFRQKKNLPILRLENSGQLENHDFYKSAIS